MIAIKINDVEYTNIASVSPLPVYDFYYDVKTMDGKRHRNIKGKRTNYDVVFYNSNYAEYDTLKQILFSSKSVMLEVPNGAESPYTIEEDIKTNCFTPSAFAFSAVIPDTFTSSMYILSQITFSGTLFTTELKAKYAIKTIAMISMMRCNRGRFPSATPICWSHAFRMLLIVSISLRLF